MGQSPIPVKKRITETQTFREFSSETCVTCDSTQDSYLRWENDEHSMTSTSESHEEASTSMSRGQRRSRIVSTQNMFSAKKRKRIGCWNVRTLNEVGRAAILTAEMRRYNLSLLDVSELRWTGHGRLRISTGEIILFSGSENRHERGVALILAKGLEKCLREWEPVNERIIQSRFYGKHLNTTIIQIYAPTNEADPEEKEEFMNN